jgi:hypothetical protein
MSEPTIQQAVMQFAGFLSGRPEIWPGDREIYPLQEAAEDFLKTLPEERESIDEALGGQERPSPETLKAMQSVAESRSRHVPEEREPVAQPFLEWNHPDLHQIRADAYDVEAWCEDQHCAVLPIRDTCTFLVVSYYKHRGRTEGLWVVDGDEIRPATTEDVAEYNALARPPVATAMPEDAVDGLCGLLRWAAGEAIDLYRENVEVHGLDPDRARLETVDDCSSQEAWGNDLVWPRPVVDFVQCITEPPVPEEREPVRYDRENPPPPETTMVCHHGHESLIGLWNCPVCTDPMLASPRLSSLSATPLLDRLRGEHTYEVNRGPNEGGCAVCGRDIRHPIHKRGVTDE